MQGSNYKLVEIGAALLIGVGIAWAHDVGVTTWLFTVASTWWDDVTHLVAGYHIMKHVSHLVGFAIGVAIARLIGEGIKSLWEKHVDDS
jgi:hypothetical protein